MIVSLLFRLQQLARANIEKTRHVICYADWFYDDVTSKVRNRGARRLIQTGPVDNLKSEYRAALARDGWIFVEAPAVEFQVAA